MLAFHLRPDWPSPCSCEKRDASRANNFHQLLVTLMMATFAAFALSAFEPRAPSRDSGTHFRAEGVCVTGSVNRPNSMMQKVLSQLRCFKIPLGLQVTPPISLAWSLWRSGPTSHRASCSNCVSISWLWVWCMFGSSQRRIGAA